MTQDRQADPSGRAPAGRGYFAIGVEGISKPMNLGNLMRSAHAFGAHFVFTIGAHDEARAVRSDTSKAPGHVPLYAWGSVAEMRLPEGCKLIGIELLDEALELPSFPHPMRAAYVLGPERGALSDELVARCDAIAKIPTQFCINVSTAGAIVMYDRVRSLGRFAPRPLSEGRRTEPLEPHVHGGPVVRGRERSPD